MFSGRRLNHRLAAMAEKNRQKNSGIRGFLRNAPRTDFIILFRFPFFHLMPLSFIPDALFFYF